MVDLLFWRGLVRRTDLDSLHSFHQRPEDGVGRVQLDALSRLGLLLHLGDARDVERAVLGATYEKQTTDVSFVRKVNRHPDVRK